MKNKYCVICGNYRKFKILKYHIFSKKHQFSVNCSKCENEDKKIFKEKESIEILKVLGLIKNI